MRQVLTMRNLGGIALLLTGTTWLWLTPAFASKGVSTDGGMWALTRVLSLVTLAGFCVATWGLFAREEWWESAALASTAVGLVALVTYALAARNAEAGGTVAWNVFVHLLMLAGILVLLLVPSLERWVDGQVMGG